MNPRINEFITENYNELRDITKKITRNHELADELLQDVMLQLYERNNLKLKTYDDNAIRYYIVAVLKLNWNSSTSPFHYKFRKDNDRFTSIDNHYDLSVDEYEEDIFNDRYELFEESIEQLDYFDKILIELYLELGSYKSVKNKTNIPIPSISRYMREIKEEIKQYILCQEQQRNPQQNPDVQHARKKPLKNSKLLLKMNQ